MTDNGNSMNRIPPNGRWFGGIAGVVVVAYSLWFAINGRIGTRDGGYSEDNPVAAAIIGGLCVFVGVLLLVVSIRGRH